MGLVPDEPCRRLEGSFLSEVSVSGRVLQDAGHRTTAAGITSFSLDYHLIGLARSRSKTRKFKNRVDVLYRSQFWRFSLLRYQLC